MLARLNAASVQPCFCKPSCSGAEPLLEAPFATCGIVVHMTLDIAAAPSVCRTDPPCCPRAKGAPEQRSRLPRGEWSISPEYLGLRWVRVVFKMSAASWPAESWLVL